MTDSPIPYARQSVSDPDIEAVVRVLRSDWLPQGPTVERFEKAVPEYCGALVDFVDIDPRTWNLSLSALKEKLEASETAGKLPKVVVPVHFAGQSCDMARISDLAVRFGFTVIEDASHATGGRYRGNPIGTAPFPK